jgi:hypothetical protein
MGHGGRRRDIGAGSAYPQTPGRSAGCTHGCSRCWSQSGREGRHRPSPRHPGLIGLAVWRRWLIGLCTTLLACFLALLGGLLRMIGLPGFEVPKKLLLRRIAQAALDPGRLRCPCRGRMMSRRQRIRRDARQEASLRRLYAAAQTDDSGEAADSPSTQRMALLVMGSSRWIGRRACGRPLDALTRVVKRRMRCWPEHAPEVGRDRVSLFGDEIGAS